MKTNVLTLIITMVVGIIMTGALLAPIISDNTDTEKTLTNVGANYSLYEAGETHTITFTTDSMITDGVAQPLPDISRYGSATIAYGEGGLLRLASNGVSWWGNISGEGSSRFIGSASSTTITISDAGACTATGANNSRSFSGTIMYANPSGNLALTYNPYVLEDSTIYGCGTTTVDAIAYGIYWSGNVSEITANAIVPPTQTFGTIETNTTNTTTNLLQVDSVVIPNDTAGTDFTYTYFFAPKEITYDNPNYVGSENAAILGAIPIVVIVAILMLAVGAIAYRRAD